jgi:hypothetical protein
MIHPPARNALPCDKQSKPETREDVKAMKSVFEPDNSSRAERDRKADH